MEQIQYFPNTLVMQIDIISVYNMKVVVVSLYLLNHILILQIVWYSLLTVILHFVLFITSISILNEQQNLGLYVTLNNHIASIFIAFDLLHHNYNITIAFYGNDCLLIICQFDFCREVDGLLIVLHCLY